MSCQPQSGQALSPMRQEALWQCRRERGQLAILGHLLEDVAGLSAHEHLRGIGKACTSDVDLSTTSGGALHGLHLSPDERHASDRHIGHPGAENYAESLDLTQLGHLKLITYLYI